MPRMRCCGNPAARLCDGAGNVKAKIEDRLNSFGGEEVATMCRTEHPTSRIRSGHPLGVGFSSGDEGGAYKTHHHASGRRTMVE